jgi:hypothetical protein
MVEKIQTCGGHAFRILEAIVPVGFCFSLRRAEAGSGFEDGGVSYEVGKEVEGQGDRMFITRNAGLFVVSGCKSRARPTARRIT